MAKFDWDWVKYNSGDEDIVLQSDMTTPEWWADMQALNKRWWKDGSTNISSSTDLTSLDINSAGTLFNGYGFELERFESTNSGDTRNWQDMEQGYQMHLKVPKEFLTFPETSSTYFGTGSADVGSGQIAVQTRSRGGASNQNLQKRNNSVPSQRGGIWWQGGQTASRVASNIFGYGMDDYVDLFIGSAPRHIDGGKCWVMYDGIWMNDNGIDGAQVSDVASEIFNQFHLGGGYRGGAPINGRMSELQIVARAPTFARIPLVEEIMWIGDSYLGQTAVTEPHYTAACFFACQRFLAKKGIHVQSNYINAETQTGVNSGDPVLGTTSVKGGAQAVSSGTAQFNFDEILDVNSGTVKIHQPSLVCIRNTTNDLNSLTYAECQSGGLLHIALQENIQKIVDAHDDPNNLVIVQGTTPSMRASFDTEEEYLAVYSAYNNNLSSCNARIKDLINYDTGTDCRVMVADVFDSWGGWNPQDIEFLTMHDMWLEYGTDFKTAVENNIHPGLEGNKRMGERYGLAILAAIKFPSLSAVI